MPHAEQGLEAAIGWVIRLRDPDFAEWAAFTDWLEIDATHAAAFDAAALADLDVAGNLRPAARPMMPVPIAPSPPRRAWRGRTAVVAAVAAGIVAVVAVPRLLPVVDTIVSTKAGERRSIVLGDGSRIDLNGGSKLAFAEAEPRRVKLVAGEALFTVRHDAARPFTVTAGTATLRDVGTIFNVTENLARTEVAVAEGGVLFDPDGQKLMIGAGHRLVVDSGIELTAVDAASVGSWHHDRLVYHGATVAEVAADLSRNIGEPVLVAPAVARSLFTGVIVIHSDRARLFAQVGGLLGVDATHGVSGWRLAPRTRAVD